MWWQLRARVRRRRSYREQRARIHDPRPAREAAEAAEASEAAESRRGAPHTRATLVRFKAADGTPLDGVMVGSGTVGVVLAHEYDSDLCNAWPYANYLAKRGFRALAIDMRCFGRSACPQGDAAGRVVDDLLAAAAELRHRGATKVALVGGSIGGSAALIAATRVQPPIDAVISLSGEANPTSLLHLPLNARAAVQQLTVPAMFVVANLDQYTSVDETRAMYQTDKSADKRLLVLPGQFDGFHGWQVLTNTQRNVLLNRHQSRGFHRRQRRRLIARRDSTATADLRSAEEGPRRMTTTTTPVST